MRGYEVFVILPPPFLLQSFAFMGLVFSTKGLAVGKMSEMTYFVSSGTLNLAPTIHWRS